MNGTIGITGDVDVVTFTAAAGPLFIDASPGGTPVVYNGKRLVSL